MEGVRRIAIERRHLILQHGWGFDRQKEPQALVIAAIACASKALETNDEGPSRLEQIAELAKAGAMIATEISRILALED